MAIRLYPTACLAYIHARHQHPRERVVPRSTVSDDHLHRALSHRVCMYASRGYRCGRSNRLHHPRTPPGSRDADANQCLQKKEKKENIPAWVCMYVPSFGGRATVFIVFMVMLSIDVGQLSLEERRTTTPRTAVPAVTSIILTMIDADLVRVVYHGRMPLNTSRLKNSPLRGPLQKRHQAHARHAEQGRSPAHGVRSPCRTLH